MIRLPTLWFQLAVEDGYEALSMNVIHTARSRVRVHRRGSSDEMLREQAAEGLRKFHTMSIVRFGRLSPADRRTRRTLRTSRKEESLHVGITSGKVEKAQLEEEIITDLSTTTMKLSECR